MNKKKLINYIIAFSSGLVTVFIICLSQGIFNEISTREIYRILCDGFFAVGVFWSCLGIILIATNGGLFAIFGYGTYLLFDSFKSKEKERKYKTYQDYRDRKGDGKKETNYLLLVGLFFIALAVIMLIFYYNVK